MTVVRRELAARMKLRNGCRAVERIGTSGVPNCFPTGFFPPIKGRNVCGVVKASLSDIKQGSFVGAIACLNHTTPSSAITIILLACTCRQPADRHGGSVG